MGSVPSSAARHAVCAILLGSASGCVLLHASREDVVRPDVPADRADVMVNDREDVMDELAIIDVPDGATLDNIDVVGEMVDVPDVLIDTPDVIGAPDVAMDAMSEDAVIPPPDACTATPMIDPNNCGMCGRVCTPTGSSAQVCRAGACTTPNSCRELKEQRRALPNGMYQLDPGTGAAMYGCDMEADMGGWTLVFLQKNRNETMATNPAASYYANAPLLGNSTQMLMAFRNRESLAITLGWATFVLPPALKGNPSATPAVLPENPFAVAQRDIGPMAAFVEGTGPVATTTFRYGTSSFMTNPDCSSDWGDPTSNGGRICLQGTNAPSYSGFFDSVGMFDYCTTSNQPHNSRFCGNGDLIFSLAVR